jgi:hypothetical protein
MQENHGVNIKQTRILLVPAKTLSILYVDKRPIGRSDSTSYLVKEHQNGNF